MKIGEKIRTLRLRNALTQEELAERSELTKGFISQVERDLTSPSISTLVDILEALGTDLTEFFVSRQPEKTVFTEDEFFETTHEEYGYTLEWVIPNAQKNRMEPILLTLPQGARSKAVAPHEGEEFGIVLTGSIQLQTDGSSQTVRKGQTFYLRGNDTHWLENTKKKTAQILWVSSPPIF